MLAPNQYGRTSFLFAGVPGMQMPVSFYKERCPSCAGVNLSIYEQVHNASLFSLYLPIANEADIKWAETGRNYTDLEFYHTLLMTNHMERHQDTFAEGIRGRTLWHNEYRSQVMYATRNTAKAPAARPSPTSCSRRPLPPRRPRHLIITIPVTGATCVTEVEYRSNQLPTRARLIRCCRVPPGLHTKRFLLHDRRSVHPLKVKDYTFTGVIEPMKLVFFDLKRVTSTNDPSVYSRP